MLRRNSYHCHDTPRFYTGRGGKRNWRPFMVEAGDAPEVPDLWDGQQYSYAMTEAQKDRLNAERAKDPLLLSYELPRAPFVFTRRHYHSTPTDNGGREHTHTQGKVSA